MQVQIKYFASVRETVGRSQETVQTDASTVAQLMSELQSQGEPYATALSSSKALRIALNQSLIHHTEVALTEGCELAFFPPVTGG